MKKVFLATNNKAKRERYERLLLRAKCAVSFVTARDLGIAVSAPEETGNTLFANAEIKARAYFQKTDLPILANDAGFWVEGEGFVAAPKRITLEGRHEKEFSKEELYGKILTFWQNIARKYSGSVNAAWIDAFVLLTPDGRVRKKEVKREVILTDRVFGVSHIQFPVRSLHISKTTGKPSARHTEKEEFQELAPITEALVALVG